MNKPNPTDHRAIPITPLTASSDEQTEAVRTLLYLDELERQATIFLREIERAWMRGMDRSTLSRDEETWGALQSALFAAIVVTRLLRPTGVRKYPHHASHSESAKYANQRGEKLRHLLEIEDASPLLSVAEVRDAIEHIDERLDHLMVPNTMSVSDWHISDGEALVTPPIAQGSGEPERIGYGLRIFFPLAGLLFFRESVLDLYALDIAMVDLQEQILKARDSINASFQGRAGYGGQRVVELLSHSKARERAETWLRMRGEAGRGLNVTLATNEPATPPP